MTRERMAEVFEEIALLMELKGENPFKIRAYRTGAETVMSFPGDIIARAQAGDLAGIKGIGEALRDKLHEMATTGGLKFYDYLRGEFPNGIFELFELQGLGPKKVAMLYKELGVASIANLKEAIEGGKLQHLAGFGEKSVQKLEQSIAFHFSHAGVFRQEQVAHDVADILTALRGHPDVSRAEVAGSYRRGKETVGDLDFLVATPHPEEVMAYFTNQPWVADIIANGPTKSSVHLASGIQCDLRAVTNAQFPFALAYFTGSKEHNVALRSRALKYGWTLNEYRFASTSADGPPPPANIHEEEDIYRALELDYIEPELREGLNEVELAKENKIPKLIEVTDLKGILHNHSTYSDGMNSLKDMAEYCKELGYEYLGICDHSQSAFYAGGLKPDDVYEQHLEIAELNKKLAPFKIFKGIESDILNDG